MKTGKYAKDGREMQVGDVVHFRCKNHPLSGKGVVFMGKEVDGLGAVSYTHLIWTDSTGACKGFASVS